jgi:hypothetical protein
MPEHRTNYLNPYVDARGIQKFRIKQIFGMGVRKEFNITIIV